MFAAFSLCFCRIFAQLLAKDGLYEAKHQCMLRNGVQILTWDSYRKYLKYAHRKYGKKFFRQIPKVKDLRGK